MIIYERVLEKNVRLKEIDIDTSTADFSKAQISWKDLCEFLTICKGENVSSVSDAVLSMCDALGVDESLWPLLLSSTDREETVRQKIDELTLLDKKFFDYFYVWKEIRQFLHNLGHVKIDPAKFSKSCPSNARAVSAVCKDPNSKISYSTAGSSTGRLTVTRGPNFLVLPRESRNALCATQKGSSIYSIDFTSLEPRVALWVSSANEFGEDIYSTVMKMCDIDKREVAKQATLSALYGASVNRLAATVGNRTQAKGLIERVSNFFEVSNLEKMLENQAAAGTITNMFGRPLYEATKQPRVRVNHFIQSTAADLANLLFSRLCKKNPAVKPLLVIHDALIVEVPPANEKDFFSDCESIYYDSVWFPTKSEKMNN
mgnify:CR=1 FL=1|tara:strand:+ start:504 stop:1622 length:1119 start_codon:yes stop_codon:yes gene_type:complete